MQATKRGLTPRSSNLDLTIHAVFVAELFHVPCCAVSGHVPEQPVINKSTGSIYEKRLIEKSVQVRTRCKIRCELVAEFENKRCKRLC